MYGNALKSQAEQREGIESDKLFKQAYKKYKEAINIRPDDVSIYHLWAGALLSQAQLKYGVKSDELFNKAYEIYGEAIKIKPDSIETYGLWADALMLQIYGQSRKEIDAISVSYTHLTDTGRQVEDTKASEITLVKELGKLTP